MALFPPLSSILGILLKTSNHLLRYCHLYLIFILQHVLTLTVLPSKTIFQNSFQCAYVCGKFPETFILENIFNMSLCLNGSLAEYSILESK